MEQEILDQNPDIPTLDRVLAPLLAAAKAEEGVPPGA